MCVTFAGCKVSSSLASSICLAHIFFKNNRVIRSGLDFGFRVIACFRWMGGSYSVSNLLRNLSSYSFISRSSLSRSSRLFRTDSSTHRSHRTSFPSFFVPALSASKHSRQMRLGTPQVGQRRFPRYISQGLRHASHLPNISSAALPFSSPKIFFVLSTASSWGGAWANRLSNV